MGGLSEAGRDRAAAAGGGAPGPAERCVSPVSRDYDDQQTQDDQPHREAPGTRGPLQCRQGQRGEDELSDLIVQTDK